jgi:predicted peptidase
MALIVGLLLAVGCAAPRAVGWRTMSTDASARGFLLKTVEVDGDPRLYSVYVPADYDGQSPMPLIVFLHGAGERGLHGTEPLHEGLGEAVMAHPERWPAIVLFPQCRPRVWWDEQRAVIDAALADTMTAYRIDGDRIYLTGISMGGYATWMYGADRADFFAALAPICGGGSVEDAEALARVPIWAFHGALDPVVDVGETRTMVDAVQEAGGLVKYTEYPDLEHNSWDRAYADPEFAAWLFKQRLSKRR